MKKTTKRSPTTPKSAVRDPKYVVGTWMNTEIVFRTDTGKPADSGMCAPTARVLCTGKYALVARLSDGRHFLFTNVVSSLLRIHEGGSTSPRVIVNTTWADFVGAANENTRKGGRLIPASSIVSGTP